MARDVLSVPDDVTHVLAWWPAGLLPDLNLPAALSAGDEYCDGGAWELLTSFEYSASAGGHWATNLICAPRDANWDELEPLVAEIVGHGVSLFPEQQVLGRWPFGRLEPIWYVTTGWQS